VKLSPDAKSVAEDIRKIPTIASRKTNPKMPKPPSVDNNPVDAGGNAIEAPFIFKDNVYLSLGQVGVFQHNKDKPYSFDQWQAKKKHDLNGLFINRESAPKQYSETKIIFNDTNVSKQYQLLNGEYYFLDNKRIKGDLILKPFSSEILLMK